MGKVPYKYPEISSPNDTSNSNIGLNGESKKYPQKSSPNDNIITEI